MILILKHYKLTYKNTNGDGIQRLEEDTSKRWRRGHSTNENGTLGGSESNEDERSNRERVDRRSLDDRSNDSLGGRRTAKLSEK